MSSSGQKIDVRAPAGPKHAASKPVDSVSLACSAPLRADLAIIADWIPEGSRVLDLGCGDGTLLAWLQTHKQVSGYGLEIDAENITACIRKGVQVIEQDLDRGDLGNFQDQQFDFVVMTQALQAVRNPDRMLAEMLRLSRECIVTFPNFAYWKLRAYLALKGRMPVSDTLPYSWYDTPNIHLCTFRDFEDLCHSQHIRILRRSVLDNTHRHHWAARRFPNFFGQIAMYCMTR